MRVKKLYNRQELFLFPGGLDEKIAADNEVRLIDTFVNALDLESGDFTIRRKLERCCKINIEMKGNLSPYLT